MMTATMINNLTNSGARRWTKGNMDRLYINSRTLIDVAEKSGILENFCWNGIISGRYSRELSSVKTYIDINDGTLHTTDRLCKAAAEIMIRQATPAPEKRGYDKRAIMRRAWALRRAENLDMSTALRRAWAEAKSV